MTRLVHLYCQAEFMPTVKIALITGITGQDGSYLAELLLEKGYQVHGIKRRASSFNTTRIDHLYQDTHESDPRLILHYGDLTDSTNLIRIIQQVQPDEIYNLGAQSHVAVSLRVRSTPPIVMHWVPCGFWRRFGSWGSPTKLGSIKPARVSSTAWFRRSHKTRPRRFIHVAPMELPSSMPTG